MMLCLSGLAVGKHTRDQDQEKNKEKKCTNITKSKYKSLFHMRKCVCVCTHHFWTLLARPYCCAATDDGQGRKKIVIN